MNHPKFNPWSDSCYEVAPPPPAPSPNLGEGGKTGNGVMRVRSTRITPFPELIPPLCLEEVQFFGAGNGAHTVNDI